MHPSLAPLAGLIGDWRGEGAGHYPTIADFAYRESVRFGHVGKPFLAYEQRTRHPDTGAPMHAETGYLRVTAAGVELVLAHPTGIVEVEEGAIETAADVVTFELRTSTVGRTATAKDVRSLRRRFVLDGDTLRYDVWMAHADTPETHHLAALLRRDR